RVLLARDTWAADTDISQPVPPDDETPVLVDFQGFGFTMNGIAHNLSEADAEDLFYPSYAPEGYQGHLDVDSLGGPEGQ
ncbi:MAG: hypothetical protein R3330_13545, partial [Saprospiraceae bacterium]|nr:hypothetical protein [Saprospiraceae bacterium]